MTFFHSLLDGEDSNTILDDTEGQSSGERTNELDTIWSTVTTEDGIYLRVFSSLPPSVGRFSVTPGLWTVVGVLTPTFV